MDDPQNHEPTWMEHGLQPNYNFKLTLNPSRFFLPSAASPSPHIISSSSRPRDAEVTHRFTKRQDAAASKETLHSFIEGSEGASNCSDNKTGTPHGIVFMWSKERPKRALHINNTLNTRELQTSVSNMWETSAAEK